MMQKIFYFSFIIVLLFSCTDNSTILEKELANAKYELEKVNLELKTLSEKASKGKLVHQVYFNLKADLSEIDKEIFTDGLEKLGGIEVVESMVVEERKNVGDEQRALTQFDVLMELRFENKAALEVYAKDDFHQEIKKEIGRFLAKPPMTFDYVID
jgi:hypothetical protein